MLNRRWLRNATPAEVEAEAAHPHRAYRNRIITGHIVAGTYRNRIITGHIVAGAYRNRIITGHIVTEGVAFRSHHRLSIVRPLQGRPCMRKVICKGNETRTVKPSNNA